MSSWSHPGSFIQQGCITSGLQQTVQTEENYFFPDILDSISLKKKMKFKLSCIWLLWPYLIMSCVPNISFHCSFMRGNYKYIIYIYRHTYILQTLSKGFSKVSKNGFIWALYYLSFKNKPNLLSWQISKTDDSIIKSGTVCVPRS